MSPVPAVPSPSAPPYAAALTITGGAWHSLVARGSMVPLVQRETFIGRLESNDVVLVDPGASRLHAVIRWGPQGYTVEDLGSTNGTLLGGLTAARMPAVAFTAPSPQAAALPSSGARCCTTCAAPQRPGARFCASCVTPVRP